PDSVAAAAAPAESAAALVLVAEPAPPTAGTATPLGDGLDAAMVVDQLGAALGLLECASPSPSRAGARSRSRSRSPRGAPLALPLQVTAEDLRLWRAAWANHCAHGCSSDEASKRACWIGWARAHQWRGEACPDDWEDPPMPEDAAVQELSDAGEPHETAAPQLRRSGANSCLALSETSETEGAPIGLLDAAAELRAAFGIEEPDPPEFGHEAADTDDADAALWRGVWGEAEQEAADADADAAVATSDDPHGAATGGTSESQASSLPLGSHVATPVDLVRARSPSPPPAPVPRAALPSLGEWSKPVVRNTKDIFSWAHDGLRALAATHGTSLLYDVKRAIHDTTYTTAFTGIDAPGTAGAVLAASLEDILGEPVRPMRHLCSIEIAPEANKELAHLPHSLPEHMFTDIMDFWQPEMKASITKLLASEHGVTLKDLVAIVKEARHPQSSSRPVRTFARCARCRGWCSHPTGKVHWAGTPCPDWAPIGTNEGADGQSSCLLAIWAALRLVLQEVVVLHENSHRFDVEILRQLLGKTYIIFSHVVEPPEFGWPVRRQRRFTLLLHKTFVMEARSTLANTIPLFYRTLRCTLDQFCIADAAELKAELEWARNRPLSRARGVPVTDADLIPSSRAFLDSLTTWELENLREYQRGSPTPFVCHNLSQDAKKDRGWSSTECFLSAVIRNPQVIWYDAIQRWLTPFELGAAQGFPVREDLATPRGPSRALSSFNRARPRQRAQVMQQFGNSMNLHVCGVHWLYVLAE
ncbi:unnamed protein product, partial [Prorocentrum cordatum]